TGGSFDVVLTNAFTFSQPIVLGVTGDKSVRLTSYNPADPTPENTDQAFNGTISGIGSFRRSISSGGGGRTIFAADNTYSGGTTIDAGTLMVNNPGPGSGTGTGTVTVNANGVLCGSGRIGGNTVVNTGGTISAGPVGMLTLANGLTLNSAGTNVWELTGPSDDAVAGAAGVDYDQLTISGGSLVLGGSSKLALSFPGDVSAPSLSDPFWQYSHTWTIVKLAGGSNPGNTTFSSIINPTNAAGYFTTSVSGGNVLLKFKSWATNDLFWSADGITRGGAGNWATNTSSVARFGNSSDGPFTQLWSNTSGKGAVFAGNGGSVTNTTNITVSVITVGSDGYTFEGTTNITFSGSGAGVNYSYVATGDSHKLSFNGPLAGSLFTKTGAGRVHLNNSGNTVSKWSVKEGMISITTVGRLGVLPGSPVADLVTLDGGGLGFDGTSPTMDTNRGITLGTNGGKLGVRSSSVTLTLQSKITGPGGLSFPGYSGFPTRIHGGPGTFIMNNTANDYQGGTTVSVGTLKLGAAGVLPDATTLTITGSASVDLATFNETISTLVLNGSGASVVGTTGTLTATNGYDVRNGTVAGTFGGSGIFTKSTTNVVSITSSNVYKGGTIVDEGTLLVNNTTGSGVGTNTVIVADIDGQAATLGGTGIIGGNVVVNRSGNISPGVVTNTGILTVTNGLNMTNGGTYTWELANLKDDSTGVAGTDFDKLSITGGQLRLDGSSVLSVQFLGTNAPDASVTFWTAPHTWTIVTLSGSAVNVGGCGFSNVVVIPQGNNAGTFSNYVSGSNIKMDFLPNVFTGQSVHVPAPIAPALLVAGNLESGVRISWAAVRGKTYDVQYTTDLSNPDWKVLTEIVADGPTVSFTDFPQSDDPQGFYRLIAK
ncbi:MAG: beta strand repeat-containing protein, partial [Limisphaerales bacterium]